MSNLTLWRQFDPFADFFGDSRVARGFVPAAEVSRDGADAVVRLEVPGLDVAKDVSVEVERGRLVVRGERRDERADKAAGRSEVRYGAFRREFGLPRHVTADAVRASYDAGVLSVRVSGAYDASGEARQIPVTAGAQTPAVEAGSKDEQAA